LLAILFPYIQQLVPFNSVQQFVERVREARRCCLALLHIQQQLLVDNKIIWGCFSFIFEQCDHNLYT